MNHDCVDELKSIATFSYGAYVATDNKAFKVIYNDLLSVINCFDNVSLDTESKKAITTESMENINI